MPSPFGIFEKYLSKVVPACVEMVLNREGKIYFTYREDKYWKGHHIPGSYMGPRETLTQTCQRIADRKVPGIKIINTKIIGAVSHPDSPRFHDASLVTIVHFEGEIPSELKGDWFEMNNPPRDLIDVHLPYIPIIRQYLLSR